MKRRVGGHGAESRSMLDRYAETVGAFVSRRRSERTLGAARMDAELASRAKTTFLANMSHELRTPLNAIIGFSQMLGSRKVAETLGEQRFEYAQHIESAGTHLLGIVSDILDMSRIEARALETEPVSSRLPDLLSPCEVMLRDKFLAKRQAFKMTFGPDLARIDVDPRRFKQVIINLLSNANKFTPEDGAIELSAWQADDDQIEVVVSDTGIGMTEDEMAMALKPFGQVQSGLNRQQEGTGLGLPLARRLTELQGGMFHLASEPSVGTRVTLTFPSSEITAARQMAPAAELKTGSLP